MKRSFAVALAALLIVFSLSPPARAQAIIPFPWKSLLPASGALTAEDTDVAMIIKYVGAQPSGTMAVVAGDILLKHGLVSAEIADTTITGCGATAGTIAIATCTTLGAVVDKINASANWRVVILDGLRTDLVSSQQLLAVAAASASKVDGVPINWDTSVALTISYAPGAPRSMKGYLAPGVSPALITNPFAGRQTILYHINETTTFGSGTSFVTVTSVQPKNVSGGNGAETNIQQIFRLAGGATTVNKVALDALNQSYVGLLCNPDSKCLVRVTNSVAMTVSTLVTYGVIFRY